MSRGKTKKGQTHRFEFLFQFAFHRCSSGIARRRCFLSIELGLEVIFDSDDANGHFQADDRVTENNEEQRRRERTEGKIRLLNNRPERNDIDDLVTESIEKASEHRIVDLRAVDSLVNLGHDSIHMIQEIVNNDQNTTDRTTIRSSKNNSLFLSLLLFIIVTSRTRRWEWSTTFENKWRCSHWRPSLFVPRCEQREEFDPKEERDTLAMDCTHRHRSHSSEQPTDEQEEQGRTLTRMNIPDSRNSLTHVKRRRIQRNTGRHRHNSDTEDENDNSVTERERERKKTRLTSLEIHENEEMKCHSLSGVHRTFAEKIFQMTFHPSLSLSYHSVNILSLSLSLSSSAKWTRSPTSSLPTRDRNNQNEMTTKRPRRRIFTTSLLFSSPRLASDQLTSSPRTTLLPLKWQLHKISSPLWSSAEKTSSRFEDG